MVTGGLRRACCATRFCLLRASTRPGIKGLSPQNSLRIVARVQPKRAFFTHICHDLPHHATNATLPPNVRLSYDGMKLDFEI